MDIDIIGLFLTPSYSATAIIEDAISDIVDQQINVGLKHITSGGLRWNHWRDDFFFGFNGIINENINSGHIYSQIKSFSNLVRFNNRISFNPLHPYFDDTRYLSTIIPAGAICRQIIPSPSELYIKALIASKEYSNSPYESEDILLYDIAETYNKTILALYECGCRSIILDDTICGKLCETNYTKQLLLSAIDIIELQNKIINVINNSLVGLPSDLEIAIYLSSGDTIIPEWEYIQYPDNIMPRILKEVNVNKFFMPFDTHDDYSAKILQHIPSNKKVVLGLIDAHSPFPDNEENIIRFIRIAQKQIEPSQLLIGAKTGFKLSNSAIRGLEYNSQWNKIKTLTNISHKI